MYSPYGIKIIDNCQTCVIRQHYLFCNLPADLVIHLNNVKATGLYPKGALLFVERQLCRGAFVLCTGKAKLSACAGSKTLIMKLAVPGEVLGLSSVILNRPHEVTAEMIEPGQANFIPRAALMDFLNINPDVALRAACLLSESYYSALEKIRLLGLSSSPSQRLAKFLLSLSPDSERLDVVRVSLTLTHEEIGRIIGTTRETVSRLFAVFTRKRLLQLKGKDLFILSRFALEGIAEY